MTVLPLPVMVPTVLLPFAEPSTVQITEVLVVPATLAARVRVPAVGRLAVPGVNVMETTGGGATVMVAEALFVVSAELVARTVWVQPLVGAV